MVDTLRSSGETIVTSARESNTAGDSMLMKPLEESWDVETIVLICFQYGRQY